MISNHVSTSHSPGQSFSFRQAIEADVPAVALILRQAVDRMLAEGKQQWDYTYPNAVHVSADIDLGIAYVLQDGPDIVAYGAVTFDGEPVYDRLEGQWLYSGPYVVLHRLAVAQSAQGRGVGAAFLRCVGQLAASRGVHSFKVDTNFDNFSMLRLLEKEGFAYCGDVRYDRGPRLAFEKLI